MAHSRFQLDACACYRLRQKFSAYGLHYSYTTSRYFVNRNTLDIASA
jgi:hypothetical protein